MFFLLFLLHPSLRIGSPKTKKELVCLYDLSILAHLLIFVNRKISLIKFLKLRLFWPFLHSERIQGKVGNLRLHRLEKSN